MNDFQFVGVDVSKDKFDVASAHFSSRIFSMNPAGFRKFVSFLKKQIGNPWVCMEATGHYSEVLAEYLCAEGIRISIVNPLQIKSFARSRLARNKNDHLDARIIADFCELMQPRTFKPRPESQIELRELLKFLDMLKMQLVQLTNQLGSTRSRLAREEIRKAIAVLERKIREVEQKVQKLVSEKEDLSEKMDLLCSIKGIGKLTAFKILALLPDVSQFANAKQFAAFIGVTPRQFQSGRYQGRTVLSRLGNSSVRKSLFMAALVAKRFNLGVQSFVRRLEEKGKAPKAIVCAVMRKLAHVVYGVLKNQKLFNAEMLAGA